MSQSPEIIQIRKIFAEQDGAQRDGVDETLKIIIAITSVLISFISTNFSKLPTPSNQVTLIKVSLACSAICLLLSVLRVYQNKVGIPKQAIAKAANIVQKSSTVQEILQGLGSLSIDHSVMYRYSIPLIVATFCVSILTLVVSTLIS